MSRANSAPDLIDWWGDFDIDTPPPAIPARPQAEPAYVVRHGNVSYIRRKSKKAVHPANAVIFVIAVAMVFTLAVIQIGRLSTISYNSKRIAQLGREVQELQREQESLAIRLNIAQNIERVKDRADDLGMVYPGEGQVRVIHVPGTSENANSHTVDNTGADAQ